MTPGFRLFLLFVIALVIGTLLGLALPEAQALEQQGRVLTLTPEELASCREEGGCVLVTKGALLKALQEVSGNEQVLCRDRI